MSKIKNNQICPNCRSIINDNTKKCPTCGEIMSGCFKTPDELFGIQKMIVGFLPYLLIFILFLASLVISDINRGKTTLFDKFKPNNSKIQSKEVNFPSFGITKRNEPVPDNLALYMRNVQRQLRKNWNPPEIETTTSVTVYFEIIQDGSIKNLKILKSSGFKKLDVAALYAVRYSMPFPPFPQGYDKETINIQFDFHYNAKLKK